MTLIYRNCQVAIGALELKKSYQKNLLMGLSFAAILHLAVIGGILVYGALNKVDIEIGIPLPQGVIELGPPPSITQERRPQIEIAPLQVAPPELGIPKPEPDILVTEQTLFPSQSELRELVPLAEEGEFDPGLIQVPERRLPGPEDFVAVEIWPEVIGKTAPLYPDLARRAGVSGEVLLRVLVDEKGIVRDVTILKPSKANVGFEEAAKEAVMQWIFSPAIQNGEPVSVWVNIPVKFEIK